MRPTITCTACGTVLGVPKGGMPAAGLSCNWCGYVNLSNAETAPAPPTPKRDPRSEPEPEREPVAAAIDSLPPEVSHVARHRWADDEDDNGQPYAPKPDEIKKRKCGECGKEVIETDVVCVHCGFDSAAKKKVERTFSPIDRTWVAGWPFERRLTLFLVLQGLNGATLLMSLMMSESVGVTMFGIAMSVALQAFIIGTFDTLRVRRNKKGQCEITIARRVGFVPLETKKVPWRENEGVAFGHYDPTGLSDWWIFLILLPWFILPAILWWWFMIRADHFFAALARDRGYPETYLYRGKNEQQAKEICQVVTDATGLPLVTKI